jgi:hypothetical protein
VSPGLIPRAVFTEGPTMRHVIVMTAASSVGLMAIFVVDLLSLLWVSRLGDPKLTAAVGFATQVLFFSVSISIGLSIAIGAVVSRALGAGDRVVVRRRAASGLVHVFLIAAAASWAAWLLRREILILFGARGMTLDVASAYLAITLPATVLLGLGMALGSILRAAGDARRSMYVTLAGAIVTAILDPVFIFGLGLGVTGAAIVTMISRFVFVAVPMGPGRPPSAALGPAGGGQGGLGGILASTLRTLTSRPGAAPRNWAAGGTRRPQRKPASAGIRCGLDPVGSLSLHQNAAARNPATRKIAKRH